MQKTSMQNNCSGLRNDLDNEAAETVLKLNEASNSTKKTKLRGLSPRVNYTNRATAASQRS
jgi:hypothetical protein